MASLASFHPGENLIQHRLFPQSLANHCVSTEVFRTSVTNQSPISRVVPTARKDELPSPVAAPDVVDATVHGLVIDPDHYPVHPSTPGVRLLTAKQYARLAAQDLTRDTPERQVFPWLHGADRLGSNQAIYFLGSSERTCPIPRFVVS
jgi:hypothetical protein